jgi:hypothetical protein
LRAVELDPADLELAGRLRWHAGDCVEKMSCFGHRRRPLRQRIDDRRC